MIALSIFTTLVAYVFYAFGPSTHRSLTVLGALRGNLESTNVEELVVIPDTTHCEDVHFYAPSQTLFTACEDNAETRFSWFPPLANFDNPELARKSKGSIHVVDPKVCSS
jgi:hypothetical protein